MQRPQSKTTQEEILWQILERIDLLSNDIRSLIAAKAEDAVSNNGNCTDSETDGSGESANNFEYFTTGGTHRNEHTYASVSQPCACASTVNTHVSDAPSTPAGKRTKIGASSTALANPAGPKSSAHYQKQFNIRASKSYTQRGQGAPTNSPQVQPTHVVHATQPQNPTASTYSSAISGLSSPTVYRAMTPQEARIFNATELGPFYLSTHGLRPGVYTSWPALADDNTKVKKPIWKRIDGKTTALAMYEQAYNEGRCRTLPPLF